MSISDDVTQVLLALANYESRPQDPDKGNYEFDKEDLPKVAGLVGQQLLDALELLSGNGLIKRTRFVGDPIGIVRLTALGKLEAEKHQADNEKSIASDSTFSSEHKLPRLEVSYEGPLGKGAFGTVWRGVDKLLERDIAVKFLTATDDAFNEEALIREARTLAKIKHPNLVDVYTAAYLRHPDTGLVAPAIVMELIPGEQIEKWWETKRQPQEILNVVKGMIAGILAMHESDMLHDDVHGQNVLVMDEGMTKLIDWRYQDIAKKRSSAQRLSEREHELRRTTDLIKKLLRKQNIESASFADLDDCNLPEWANALENHLFPKRIETRDTAQSEVAEDDNDIINILEDWVLNETAKVVDPLYPDHCVLLSPLDVGELANRLSLPKPSIIRLLPDILKAEGWEVIRTGTRTMRVVPSLQLRAKINPIT